MGNKFRVTQKLQRRGQIGRPICLKLKQFARFRMAKCEGRGVERLARNGPLHPVGQGPAGPPDPAAATQAVDWIPDNRVSYVGEVYPDLVSATGVEVQPEQVGDREPGHDSCIGAGRPSGFNHRHSLAVTLVACDRSLDGHAILVQMAPRQCGIGAPHPSRCDCVAEAPVSLVG